MNATHPRPWTSWELPATVLVGVMEAIRWRLDTIPAGEGSQTASDHYRAEAVLNGLT